MNAAVTSRLAELDRMHGPHPLWMKVLVTDLVEEMNRLHLSGPSAVFGEDGAGGCLKLVWQGSAGRITVYTDDDEHTIEVVPGGPAEPFTADQVEVAAAYIAGALTGIGPLHEGSGQSE